MEVVKQIFQPYVEGATAIFLTGRSIYDLDLNEQKMVVPIYILLKKYAETEHKMAFVQYSFAKGVSCDTSMFEHNDQTIIRDTLSRARILSNTGNKSNDFLDVIRGISNLPAGVKMDFGHPLKFCFLLEFTEDLIPGGLAPGTQTENQILASELSYILSNNYLLRKSGNYVIFNGRENLVDKFVLDSLIHVRLLQPDMERKKQFIEALEKSNSHNKAAFGDNLEVEEVANLTSNTPNQGLERIMLASHRTETLITSGDLVKQKEKDVETLSEDTITLLDTSRVSNVELRGANIQIPLDFLKKCAEGLRKANPNTPMNILLAGAPSSGKTDLALITASMAGVPAYQLNSPKGSLVGQTEQRARIQQEILKEMFPNLAFIDEITDAFDLQRNSPNLDAGASMAVTAALLTALSDKSRAGKSLFVATTNCPWRVGAAMLSRFIVVPVLLPLKEDYPGIISSIARSIRQDIDIDANSTILGEAAKLFYLKNATPRTIRSAITSRIGITGVFEEQTILDAAEDICPQTIDNKRAAEYADLFAIKVTPSKSFLPWNNNPGYNFPDYIKTYVDQDGNIDYEKLEAELKVMAGEGINI
jgi:AAA+ superfamily predicted ATPase